MYVCIWILIRYIVPFNEPLIADYILFLMWWRWLMLCTLYIVRCTLYIVHRHKRRYCLHLQ